MKRYRFRLESVMHVRRTQEDVARQRLAIANADVRRSYAALGAATGRYQALAETLGPLDVDSFRDSRLSGENSAAGVAAARRRVELAESAAEARRAEWSHAARQVSALERLDERRQSEWWTDFRRQEDVEVDDMVTARRHIGAAGFTT